MWEPFCLISIYKNPDQILFAVSYFLFPLERVFTISLICKVFRGSAPNISYRTGFFSKVLSRSSQNTAAAAAAAPLQSCPTVRPHRQQPTRLCCPWDSPGKNTGVGCHFLLQCMKVKSESEVAQSCPTLSDPMDCSPPDSSVREIFQARIPTKVFFLILVCYAMGFPSSSAGKESVCNVGDPVGFLGQEDPLEKG